MGLVLAAPLLFAPVGYYIAWAKTPCAMLDWDGKFNKRLKDSHRYTIADVNGKLNLTIPIHKPESLSNARWSDIRISSHGDWQSVHKTALESAYGRTPYFEFYIDSFLPLFSREWNNRTLRDYIEESNGILSDLLCLDFLRPNRSCEDEQVKHKRLHWDESFTPVYWQPRLLKLGFIANLSILDTLFCIGPETILFFKDMGIESEKCGQAV